MHKDPEVRLYYNFLKEGEADYLIKLGTPLLIRSSVVDSYKLEEAHDSRRTSYGAPLPVTDEVLINIKNRICLALNVTMDQIENPSMLRYTKGQEFKAHYDWLSDKALLVQEDTRQR